jgi:hypothetical protein
MAVEKLSVSLPDVVVARARRAAKRAGVPLSTWLAEAATAAAELDEARVALEEFQAIYGPPDPEAAKEMDAELEAAGFGRAETPEEFAMRQAAIARLRGQAPIGPDRRHAV